MSKYHVCDICNEPINTINHVRNGFTMRTFEFDATKSGRIVRRRKNVCVCGFCFRELTSNLKTMKNQNSEKMAIGFSAPKEKDSNEEE